MVCGGGRESQARNAAIERMLRKDHQSERKELKLLLLGTGESGKSTIVKQMRIIYGQGYTDQDRKEFRELVYRNLLISMKAILDFIDRETLTLQQEDLVDVSYDILDTDEKTFSDIQPLAPSLVRLWADATVKLAVTRRAEFTLSDSALYYYDDIQRLIDPEYLPTVQDVLRARIATSGIHEFGFDMGQGTNFRMLDVGGQRSERKKWIHCFEGITSIIFIVACSEYDQHLVEDRETNRMVESLALFEQIVTYSFFRATSFILFLNKQDLLAEKIKKSSLKPHFPDYEGPEGDLEGAKEFIWQMYAAKKPKQTELFKHYTMATDTGNITFVFKSVKTTLLRNNMKDYGLG